MKTKLNLNEKEKLEKKVDKVFAQREARRRLFNVSGRVPKQNHYAKVNYKPKYK